MQPNQLDEFITSLIKDKDLGNISDEVREQLVADMKVRALDMIDREVIRSLSDEQTATLNTMLDSSASDQEVQEFIRSSVPDLADITAKTLFRFREAYLR